MLGEQWKSLTDKEKTPYEAKAAADKKRYEEEKAAYTAVCCFWSYRLSLIISDYFLPGWRWRGGRGGLNVFALIIISSRQCPCNAFNILFVFTSRHAGLRILGESDGGVAANGQKGCFLFSSSDDMSISYQLAASIVGAAWWSHTIYGIVYLFMDHAVGGKFTVY